ncbi:MAG: alkane 1-monooxygenase [Sagittula sp.]|uniref:alkane 1-monooxygenase n=1 Tax=unclassified Sagittula TaxID=2624628 RepID=UPI000C2D5FC0|nr:alkane 1-monooxygenase [Sagittula sp. P11]AUC52900.1 alkane 1-monooxygenase [Sagittula sp. P11]
MIPAAHVARFTAALPFFLSFLLIPLVWIGAVRGGAWVLLTPLATWYLFSAIDILTGLNTQNADLDTTEDQLFWYKLLTQLWVPVQFLTLFGLIWYVSRADHLNGWEIFGVMFGTGVMTGTVGIVYSHELLHQRNRFERWLGDILLAMVLYSHFRSEHLLVHHRYVGTPRDPVTARYNEGFHRFYPRVLRESLQSSFRAERDMLARKGLPWTHRSNPFWRYWALQAGMLLLALALGGWLGAGLFLVQAGVAIWQLEVVNYVEHYGLTRKHLGDGRYEHVLPRHSWNASHRATNWLMINLQRHSDHHYRPDRRFPLLQTYDETEAPQLPYGYPLMAMAAMVPPVWKRVMNPKVRAWRARYYPEITDWSPYNKARHPMPR